jgi:hypothetical protein
LNKEERIHTSTVDQEVMLDITRSMGVLDCREKRFLGFKNLGEGHN